MDSGRPNGPFSLSIDTLVVFLKDIAQLISRIHTVDLCRIVFPEYNNLYNNIDRVSVCGRPVKVLLSVVLNLTLLTFTSLMNIQLF